MESSTKPLETKKRKWTDTGAPAQKNQPTRKGKRAWRKNIDILDIEAGTEGLREEEITTGGKLQDRSDKDLFQIDVAGDEQARKQIQKEKKPLKFMQVLQQRSAVPSVFARANSSTHKHIGKGKLTLAEKSKLLQKAKRLRKGALNSYLDPKESGSTVIEPRKSCGYNVWEAPESDDEALSKIVRSEEAIEYVAPIVKKPKVKAPDSLLPSRKIDRAAVELPHAGLSYNPSYEAHQALLKAAHEVETRREAEGNAWQEKKQQMEAMKQIKDSDDGEATTRFNGMVIDVPEEKGDAGPADQPTDAPVVAVKKTPARKTRQQKLKATRLRSEKHILAEKARRKKLAASLDAVRSIAKATNRKVAARDAAATAQKLAAAEMSRQPLVGRKIGKHTVKPAEIDVQLTDELTESFRALQPEGNLFQDRFLSMQQRALVEPRERVLPRKRTIKYKEYEKHPWKRFS